MINKKLIKEVPESKKYIAANVFFQWVSLIANIIIMFSVSTFITKIYEKSCKKEDVIAFILCATAMLLIRFFCTVISGKMSFLSSKTVKKTIRSKIYKKLLNLGSSYAEKVKSSEIVQVTVEGVDQLETYFGAYLPQFFYALIAPLTLFIVLSFVSFSSAVILLICVPLIPVAIVAVQRFAKKLLSKYWGQYTALGDTFLENLQGLTTLKIYEADEFKQKQMNDEAEKFRKITMRVLTMQLNSISVMDLIAYAGAALGVIMAVIEFSSGKVTLTGALLIILLAADFFIPMRLLGSFFHIAMNGMAASDKIFRILEIPTSKVKNNRNLNDFSVTVRNLSFSYEKDREILHNLNLDFPSGSFTGIVGKSGCGKSTVASILLGKNKNYKGSIKIDGCELSGFSDETILKNFTYISCQSYLFKGTVRENLLMADENAKDEKLIETLKRVNLWDFLKSENGLDTFLDEKAANISGGQRQRLALARALLHNSAIYIFDEATSNIDVESETDIMNEIYNLKKTKTVILISHRLMNVSLADNIYVMDDGRVVESGNHNELISKNANYKKLWDTQYELESFRTGGDN